MTDVLITVDTELSAGRQSRGLDVRANFAGSITGRTAAGDFGVGWQLDRLDERGLKGVYFVDPMPALVHGGGVIADIVRPIVARGHEVQLHVHTEWLEWAQRSPVGGRQGRNLSDFTLADQVAILRTARDLLVDAGAPAPIAFRAGNFGANDTTLDALAQVGIAWDSSANAAYRGAPCGIAMAPDQAAPWVRGGTAELPVAGLADRPGHFRAAQICAVSAREMRGALAHAARARHPAFVVVTHSFEMLSRDRLRPNRQVMARFEALCDAIVATPGLRSAGFADLDPAIAHGDTHDGTLLGPSYPRTACRMAEQLVATWRYERRLLPV